MALVKFHPFTPVATFTRLNDFDKLIADVFNTPLFNDEVKNTTPSVNVAEDGEKFRLEVAAPGLSKGDFSINIEKNVLTIAGEKKTETETKEGEKYLRREFGYTKFSRSFTLPENVNAEGITAQFDNGVLNVHIPKQEAKKWVQTIEIQ